MSRDSGATRWWEYYLPRYLMPSIAGAIIVNWLCDFGGDSLRSLLALPPGGRVSDASSLILLLLYGNLFCYVASYPVLVFHATRSMDSRDGHWPAYPFCDGYILTLLLVSCVFWVRFVPADCRYWPAFVVASAVAMVQFVRLWIMSSRRFSVKGHEDPVTHPYFYSYVLAHRRTVPDEKPEPETKDKQWRKDFVETYRHLREHGNSAFIFLLELVLAALSYCIITRPGQSATHQLGALGLLFAVWALPSIFAHLLAQQLERRFSRYDLKIRTGTQ